MIRSSNTYISKSKRANMVILHISDLHLQKGSESDTVKYVIEPLIKSIVKFNVSKKIDAIIFSGDLIDKGGISYDKIDDGFYRFADLLIYPLLNAISLDEHRFFMVPGNHDIKRSMDSHIIENGLFTSLSTEEAVNDFIVKCKNDGTDEGIKRMLPYKDFEEFIYSSVANKSLSKFSTDFILDLDGTSVGITCLNSSWRCYDSEKDKGNLLIGEYQIENSIDFIKDCDLKIAISHHSVDQLTDFERKIINARWLCCMAPAG